MKINLSKRNWYILISGLFLITNAVVNIALPVTNYYLFTAIGIALVIGLVFLYYLASKSNYDLNKLIYVFIYATVGYLLVYNFPNLNVYTKLTMITGMSVILYALFLAFNVYTVSEKYNEDIPLLKPAQSTIFVVTVLTSFMFATINYKILFFQDYQLVNLIIKIALFFIYFRLLFFITGWYFLNEKIGELREKKYVRLRAVLNYAVFATTQIAATLLFLPFEAFASAIVVTVCVYISINYIQNFISHKIDLKYNILSLLQFIFAVIAAYFIS